MPTNKYAKNEKEMIELLKEIKEQLNTLNSGLKDYTNKRNKEMQDTFDRKVNLTFLGTSLMLGSLGIIQLKDVVPSLTTIISYLFATFWILGGIIITFVVTWAFRDFISSILGRS